MSSVRRRPPQAGKIRESRSTPRDAERSFGPTREGPNEELQEVRAQLALANQRVQALAEEARYLAAIVDSSDDAIVCAKLDGTVVSWNASAERVYGYTAEEMVGRSMTVVVPPGRWHESERILSRLLEGETVDRFETQRLRKGEISFDVSLTVSPLRDEDGRITAGALIARDITHRKLTESALRYSERCLAAQRTALELAVNGAPSDVLFQQIVLAVRDLVAADAGVALCIAENEGLRYGATVGLPEAFAGSLCDAASGPVGGVEGASAIAGEAVIVSDFTGERSAVGALALRNGIRACWSFPIASLNASNLGTLTIYHRHPGEPSQHDLDAIHLLTQMAALVIEQHQAIEQRRAAVEREQAARADAEAANRFKDDFLAALSHELRTPLNAMLGYAQLLALREDHGPSTARAAAVIQRNGAMLKRLVDDLFDVSKIKSGRFAVTRVPVDMRTIAEEAVEACRPLADDRRMDLRCVANGPAEVHGDPDRLRQVAVNLLTNAIKFGARNGRVELVVDRSDGLVEMSVRDDGVGIAPESLPHVFNRPRQRASGSPEHGAGLGLGLTIVRELVELHGGTVRAASDGEGAGAVFTVTLPVREQTTT